LEVDRSMSDAWLVLAPIAGGMAAATAYLVKWAAEARTPLKAGTVTFLLVMMVAMVGGAALYFAHPSTGSLVDGLWLASAVMSVSVVGVFLAFVREVQVGSKGGPAGPPALKHVRSFIAGVIGLVLANELLMGWTFQVAAGQLAGASTGWSVLVASVDSPWFLFTMAAEMLLTSVLLRDRLPRPVLVVLVSQSLIMALSPPALPYAWWIDAAVYIASAAMIILFVYLMEFMYRQRELTPGLSTYIVRLLAIYGVMMAGLYLWVAYGNAAIFALSVVLEMVLFFHAVVRPEGFEEGPRTTWQLRPNWAFAVLASIFVAEVFMGALLDAVVSGGAFVGALPELPLSGSALTVVGNAVYNGFWFLALTTGSTWFLAMMGTEMGALVYFKFRETRSRETKVQLGLMMGSYGAFAVFFPSIYYSLVFPSVASGTAVPVLGWAMGVGSAPLALSVFGVLLATYLIVGTLTVLFGRRVVCSVFCTAPLMYQGTTIDTMKTFNRSSPLARKYLSSRFSAAYSATTSVVMVSLVAASVVSYLDQVGTLSLTIAGTDPTVFLFALYFSVLWYVMFVTIPYTGNYNCVTMGWCYTGTISQAFSRVGFFRLKVKDKEVCRRCTTLDCAKSCPVGLVDMPGHFRTKGYFRSSKCCGVGDCVNACPYGNMYFYDVRHWVRSKLGLRDRPKPAQLPMVPNAAHAHTAPGAGRPAGTERAALPAAPRA
jgi:polyferredoxin